MPVQYVERSIYVAFCVTDFEYKEDSVVVSKMEGKGTLVSRCVASLYFSFQSPSDGLVQPRSRRVVATFFWILAS